MTHTQIQQMQKEKRKEGKKKGRKKKSKFNILHIKFLDRIFIGKFPTYSQVECKGQASISLSFC